MRNVAALYVARGGVYFGLPEVDPWDESRDARLYAGPWPVVAHPPCSRWCQLARVNEARYGHKVGEDGGCFRSALNAVRTFGGVLEHPAYSIAWREFALPRPEKTGGWVQGLCGGWACHIEQRSYGHRARKATWLYAFGLTPPPLKWGPGETPEAWISTDRPRSELEAMGIGKLSKKDANATPIEFRDLLLSLARSVKKRERDETTQKLVRAAVRAFQELNEIRARGGIPFTRCGQPSSVTEDYFSSVVDLLDEAVREATGHGAHCHPELYKRR